MAIEYLGLSDQRPHGGAVEGHSEQLTMRLWK